MSTTMKKIDLRGISCEVTDSKPLDVIAHKIKELEGKDEKNPFYVCELQQLIKNYEFWQTQLPRVSVHYAMKCNSDPAVLRVLANLGIGFDCASKDEMKTILDLDVSPDKIVYSNPCKQASHIKFASEKNVTLTVFDNESELHKIKAVFPDAKLLLRIAPAHTDKVLINLSEKYGTKMKDVEDLLDEAKTLGLDVVGVSFHVGTGLYDTTIFPKTIYRARKIFDTAEEMGFKMNLLDVGGGFPGSNEDSFLIIQIMESLRQALDTHFPEETGVRFIAEPGRFLVTSAFTLTVNIIGKRRVEKRSRMPKKAVKFMYYVNDGIYSSFNCVVAEHREVRPILPDSEKYEGKPRYFSTLWGQTCDSLDLIGEDIYLPELNDGDWMIVDDMGAYSLSVQTHFNSMPVPDRHYIISEQMWNDMQQSKG